jgi:hypothetical protein
MVAVGGSTVVKGGGYHIHAYSDGGGGVSMVV